jgi:hypothetical protein
VHRLILTAQTINRAYPIGAANVRRTRSGRLIFTVPDKEMAANLRAKLRRAPAWEQVTIRLAPHPAAPRREVQVTALSVTFSGIGQPQHITAPAHAIAQYGRG